MNLLCYLDSRSWFEDKLQKMSNWGLGCCWDTKSIIQYNLHCISPHTAVMNCHLLVLETFLLTVLTRIYYRRKDSKVGYEPFPSPDLDSNIKAWGEMAWTMKETLYSWDGHTISLLSLNIDQMGKIPLSAQTGKLHLTIEMKVNYAIGWNCFRSFLGKVTSFIIDKQDGVWNRITGHITLVGVTINP